MASKGKTRRRGKGKEAPEVTSPELTTITQSLPRDQGFAEYELISKQTSSKSPWMTFILDSEEDPTARVRVFPRFAIFSLMALAFYSRHLLLTGFEGLGMLHPDENFQVIEVAHSEVYGYGFIPLEEYTTGFALHITNKTVGRPPPSWIYPRMYMLLFQAREFFGWSAAPFMLARRFHGMVAALLPYSVYKFTRTVFGRSRDIAFMATCLVAFSKHLMLLGIHPFLQSFVSPLIFASLAIVLKILGADQSCDTDHPRYGDVKRPDLSVAAKLGLLLCGFILGVVFFILAESLLIVAAALIMCSIPSHSARMDTLPSRRALVGIVVLLCGFFTGMALGAAQDYTVHGFSCWTQSRTAQFLTNSIGPGNYTMYVSSFMSGSHVHVAVMLAAALVSVIYVVHNWQISQIFDGMVGGGDAVLFRSTFRITVLAFSFLVFYSCQSHQDIRMVHDVIVLLLIAGSAGVYLLYSGLYAYVMSIASPGKTTRNMVKLILYAELLLYMFEVRMTFPTAYNRNIAMWAHEGQWESAFVNQCLRYVGQQTDVTGVAIDYPIQMTGGFSLLHRNVPIYARSGLEFREWRNENNLADRTEQSDAWFEPEDIKTSGLYGTTDFISLLNPGLLVKRLIEKTHYNYVIVSGSRKFFKKGFREVFNASDARVFKRSKSRTESEHLLTVADKIPIGTNATVLAYEGAWLIVLKNYAEAVVRLKAALEINAGDARLETWQLLIFALKELNQSTDANETMTVCKSFHGSECEQHYKVDLHELRHNKLVSDLRAVSENYKFPT